MTSTTVLLCVAVVLVAMLSEGSAQSKTPDSVFLACCKRQKRMTSGCYQYCNYSPNGFSRKALESMYYSRGCPRAAMGSYLFCVGQNYDHTKECKENKVGTTRAGDMCLDLCNLKAGTTLRTTIAHVPCLKVIDNVREVFKSNVQRMINNGRYDG